MQNTNSVVTKNIVSVRTLTKIGVLSAIAVILMLFEIPLWFAPPFYKIDLSEVVVLIGGFALGPIPGIMIELIKILLNFAFNGTITAGIGEAANFIIGCSLVVPAAIIYKRKKTIKSAMFGIVIGIVSMTIIGSFLNYIVILPIYSQMVLPMEALIGAGTAVNKYIVNLETFVLYATAPFNLLKGILTAIPTLLLYKKLSRILH